MEKASVIFSLNGFNLTIPCSKEDKMRDICINYTKKIEKNINSLIFLYEENKINFDLTFENQVNLIDKNKMKMKILVYQNEKDGIICPKCGSKIELNTKEIDDIIISYKEIKDSIKGIKLQIDNMIKNSSDESVNVQLKNINIVINSINDDFSKNNEKLKYIINKLKNYNIKNKNVIKGVSNIENKPIDKSEFKNDELEDPDCIDCLNTLSVLEFKRDKYEEKRKKIDGRSPKELLQKIIKIKCKYQELENSLGDEISPKEYLTLLKMTFDHDKKLAEYFKQVGDFKKFELVNERLPLIVNETEELIKQMKL